MDRAAPNGDFPELEVDHELAARDARLSSRPGPRDVAERNTDSRQELIDPERLGHVVVGAEVERVHFVGLAAASREHDDRRPGVLADATDHLEPISIRQVEVEHDEIRLLALIARDRITGCLRRFDLEAVAP